MTKKPKGVSFFRDLGGIPCADGRRVIDGMLYRSGHLAKLKEKYMWMLPSIFGIRHVADLRSNSEVLEKPDNIPSEVVYHRFTPLDDTLNPSVNSKNRTRILKARMAEDGGTLGHLCETYKTLVIRPESLEAYSELIKLASETNGGLLWHCTQGKDRTGLGSAVLLMALGADRQTIMDDYLSYNVMAHLKNALIYLGISVFMFNPRMASSLMNLMYARRDYLISAFEEIDTLYGGTDGFLKNGLGITDSTLNRLRATYLA